MLVLSTPSFNKDIGKIKDGKLAIRVERLIKRMHSADNISEIAGLIKQAGASNAYPVRMADCRLAFTVPGKTIRLMISAHRREIYRYFP